MSVTGHNPQKPIMIVATPRSGSTLFTRCLSKAVNKPALHEAQMRMTETDAVLKVSKARSNSSWLDYEERALHHKIYDKIHASHIVEHLKPNAGKYPIRKEMTAFTSLDIEAVKTVNPEEDGFDYNTDSMINFVSQQYFDDIRNQCERSESPIILMCANPVDIMHSVLKVAVEHIEKGSCSKNAFEATAKSVAEDAKKYYESHLKLKKICEERHQPYIEVTREQVLGDLKGTVNHVIEACGLSGEATDELSPVKLYDNQEPSPDKVEYTLSYDDAYVPRGERNHNHFIPRTERRSISERLRDAIAEKFEEPADEIMALLKESEKELQELYQNSKA